MKIRGNSCKLPMEWKLMSFSVTFLIIAFGIGNPGPFGRGGGVEARRKYTFLNKWFKVACIAENLKETDHYICDEHGYIRCLPGWSDEHRLCTVPKCEYKCEHGNCSGPDTCTCEVGWTSANCSKCICLPGCQNGFCHLPFECKCQPGWTGMLCDKPMCKPGCIHGHCNAPGECVCHPGWTGVNCSECIPLPGCHWKNGYCKKPMECQCHHGYHGNFCKHANCKPGCHQQYGYCIHPDTCWCHTGWTGEHCTECMRYPGCQNGRCSLPWECTCDPGWHGKKCDKKGDGTTTPSYEFTRYPPGHGLHGTLTDFHDPCEECLKGGRTWQPEAQACTVNCAIQDINCYKTKCPDISGDQPHHGKRDTAAFDSIQKVTRALESSGIFEDDNEKEDLKRSAGSTDVTTMETVPTPESTTPETVNLSVVPNQDATFATGSTFNK